MDQCFGIGIPERTQPVNNTFGNDQAWSFPAFLSRVSRHPFSQSLRNRDDGDDFVCILKINK
jgi:hypothetical protein